MIKTSVDDTNLQGDEKRIYGWYLKVVMVFSIISILILLSEHAFSLTFNFPQAVYFIFNLVMFSVIIAKKIEKVALWVAGLTLLSPILYLGSLFFALGMGNSTGAFYLSLATGVCVIIQVVILIFAVKLLWRK